MATNVTYIIYIGMYNDRHRLEKYAYDEVGSPERRQLFRVVTAAMTLDFLHYASLNTCLWFYCFKYWVVSVEV